jgi:anti-sigma28 factor (negative regulator of flagellin synthesis)
MELSIMQRVAKLVISTKLDPAYPEKKPLEKKVKSDSVSISEAGGEIRKVTEAVQQIPEDDPERKAKVDKLREAVSRGQYRMSESMLNMIAERIANSLV